MKNDIDLTQGSILKKFIYFCFPILLGTLFQQLYNTIDVIVLGKFVGANAIAAVGGSSGILIQFVLGLLVGLSSGVTVIISTFFGAKNKVKVEQAIQTSIFLALLGSLIFTFFGLMAVPKLLQLLNTPKIIFDDSKVYLYIYFFGIIFVFLYNIGSAILRALSDSKHPLIYLMICCLVNIVLDIFFVTILPLGVTGVAIATVSAQALSAILTLHRIKKIFPNIPLIKYHSYLLRKILWIGFPAALQSVMNSLSGIIMTIYINRLGTMAVSGNTAYAKLDAIFWMISTAFSVSISTFVAQNIGAGLKKRARKGIQLCFGLDILVSSILSIFFMRFSHQLFYLFTNNEQVIKNGMEVLHAIAPYYILVSFFEITGSALRGMEKVIFPMIINIVGLCAVRLIWILGTPYSQSLYGIILSCPISWFFTAIAMMIYYFHVIIRE